MKFRHPILFVIIVIIGIGMINSLFQESPEPIDSKMAEKEAVENREFNEAHCKSKGLIYIENVRSSGECIAKEELTEKLYENAKKLKEIIKSKANDGLK